MPESPLIAAGAQIAPINAAPLHTNRMFTGLWTQRSPLRDAATTFLLEKFYSATRFESLIGGQNTEITTRLTLARRPGSSVYNSQSFPPINRFYEFRAFQNGAENIHVMASVDANASSEELFIATVQVSASGSYPFYIYTLIVTFTAAVPPILPGQTYTFAGVTNYPRLNGLVLAPLAAYRGLTADQQAFNFSPLGTAYGPAADTGHAIVDPAAGSPTVRDVTGPATNLTLLNKNPYAGRTSFQSVGNILFFGDGYDQKKWVLSKQAWAANTVFAPGDFIVDPNNNLQLAIGAQTGAVTGIAVKNNVATVFLNALTPLEIPIGAQLNFSAQTTIAALAGTAQTVTEVENAAQFSFNYVHADLAFSVETGSVDTGTGITGGAAPGFAAAPEAVTPDGGAQWESMGPSVQNWGFAAPANAPTVTQAAAPTLYPNWQASTWYAPLFVILIGSDLFQLTTAGTTGGAAPAWNHAIGSTTPETGPGTAVWTCLGPAAWVSGATYAVGACVQATFTYYITSQQYVYDPASDTWSWQDAQTPVTVTCLFQALTAGATAPWTAGQPPWPNGLGTTQVDGAVTWINRGTAPGWPGATQTLSLDATILDSQLNLESPQEMGETGTAALAWAGGQGSYIVDNAQLWLNGGPYGKANTGAWVYAYSGENGVTRHIGTASPRSLPITVSAGKLVVLQGQGLADPQITELVLWRTLQGGTTLLYLGTIPNPGAGQSWIYTDTTPDSGLNELETAPINDVNNPPPAGFMPKCYYLGRIWGWVANVLQWSGGPDTVTGSGDEAFSPLNQATFPSLGVTCWPSSIGLLCYTNSDVWMMLGQGTAASPFYVINFQQGVGLGSEDALAVNGSTGYGMLTSGQVVSMDPGAGELEVGFPIGDQFDALYTPANTYCAWHQGSSRDMALYVADGAQGWFRMSAVAAPESGNVWSPRAVIEGGVKAIASVETAPGQKRLLLGPATLGNPILMRDDSTYQDNATPYPAFADIGSLVLAQPGTTVGVQFITVEETAIEGAAPAGVGVLFDEIGGSFSSLTRSSADPPNQPRSSSLTINRWWAMQNARPVTCRHMQIEISWPAANVANELLTYTLYGRLPEKARK